MSLIYFINFYY